MTIARSVNTIVTETGVTRVAIHDAISAGIIAAGQVCGAARFIAISTVRLLPAFVLVLTIASILHPNNCVVMSRKSDSYSES